MALAFDTETSRFFVPRKAPPLVVVTFCEGPKTYGIVHRSDPACYRMVRSWLEGPEHLVAHNLPFDVAVLAKQWPVLWPLIFDKYERGEMHDTMLRAMLADLAKGLFRSEPSKDPDEFEKGIRKERRYGLADLAKRDLDLVLPKDKWRLVYDQFYDVPVEQWPDGPSKYAIDDAKATWCVYHVQERRDAHLIQNEGAQVKAHLALQMMTCRGMRTNPEAIARLEEETRQEIQELWPVLSEAGLIHPITGKRRTQEAAKHMVRISEEPPELTDAGAEAVAKGEVTREQLYAEGKCVRLDEDACLATGDPILRQYQAYSKATNLLSGNIKQFHAGITVPIQPSFSILMATGRTSSSGSQNLRRRRGVRECFQAREGMAFVACDYSAAELITLSQVCYDLFGFSKLREAINDDVDVHLWVGAMLAGVTYEEAEARYKADDEHIAEMRQCSKAANFGYPGGCGARRFVGLAAGYGLDLDIRRSSEIKATWMQAWPEMELFLGEYLASLETADGFYALKQPRVPRWRARGTFCGIANSHFQGLAADAMKAAAWQVVKEQTVVPESDLFGSFSVNLVHDELIVECGEDRVHEVAHRLHHVMIEEFQKFTPDVKVKGEFAAMRSWTKKAKAVYSESGRLICWEDRPRKEKKTA